MFLKPAPMKRIAVLGLKDYKQAVVSILHDLGTIQLESLSKDIATILKNEGGGDTYRQISDQLLRVRSFKSILPQIHFSQRMRFESVNELMNEAKTIDIDDKVAFLEREKEKLLTDLKQTENNINLLEEFAFFPEDLRVLQLSSAHSYFGRVETKKFQAFKNKLEEYKDDIIFHLREGKDTTKVVLVVLPSFPSDAFANMIQKHSVNIDVVPKLEGTPKDVIKNQKTIHSQISPKLKKIDEQLLEISKKYYEKIMCVEEQLEIENKKLEVIENLGVSTEIFALEGWIPKSKFDHLKYVLQKNIQGIIIYDLQTNEKPPTLQSNPKKFRIFEPFIRFYSTPSSQEFDPTLIYGFVFPLFYGMMIGDVGYGLVILLVSLWVIRRVEGKKKTINIMPKMLKNFAKTILTPKQMVKLAKVLIPGCIVSIVLGFLFDLYFGFHVNGFLFNYLNSYGLNLPEHGAFLNPISSFGLRKLLLISGYFGVGMVTLGLILGIINNYWDKEKRHMLGKLGWLLFSWGIVLAGLALLSHGHINPMRHVEGMVYFGLIFSGIGLMFYGEGTRSLMELPSIVSHILSYTRLVGILVGSVILAHTIDFIFLKGLHHSLVYAIVGFVILFVGHTFNTIIGVLEPGIQGNRLIYVEFFSKFYHGNGRQFRPFGTQRRFTSIQYEKESAPTQ